MIINLKAFRESKLVPRNLDGRLEKLVQQNLKLLQQEIIEGDLKIDDSWNFSCDQIKTKKIVGDVELMRGLGYIPEWFKNVRIDGYFVCARTNIFSLEGCPYHVGDDFICADNNLTSLEGCPEYVGGYFRCEKNSIKNLQFCPKRIKNGSFFCHYNLLTSLDGMPKYIFGDFNCRNNRKLFNVHDIPEGTFIKGEKTF